MYSPKAHSHQRSIRQQVLTFSLEDIIPARTCTFPHSLVQDYYGGAEGGAFYNRGDVLVEGEADFIDNYGGVSLMCQVSGLHFVATTVTVCTVIGRIALNASSDSTSIPRSMYEGV